MFREISECSRSVVTLTLAVRHHNKTTSLDDRLMTILLQSTELRLT